MKLIITKEPYTHLYGTLGYFREKFGFYGFYDAGETGFHSIGTAYLDPKHSKGWNFNYL